MDTDGKAGIHALIVQGISLVAAWSSQLIINVLIFIRLYLIKFPFERVNEKAVWISLSFAMFHILIMESVTIPFSKWWNSAIQFSERPHQEDGIGELLDQANWVFVILPMAILYVLSGISSIYTVVLLARDTGPEETRKQKRKSARIILVLSLINWAVPLGFIYANHHWPDKDSNVTNLVAVYVVVSGMKSIVSALDPIIVLALSRDFRVYVKGLLANCYHRICSASSVDIAND